MTAPRRSRSPLSLLCTALCAAGCAGGPVPTSEPAAGPSPAAAQLPPATPPEPSRFEQQVLVPGPLDEPTELAVARDGRVFFTQRKGALRLYEPSTGAAREVARLDVFTEDENGLIGIALDPSFESTGWLYLTRTVGDTLSARHRVARFTFDGTGIADEKVLLEVPIDRGCCHTGGSMTFDGKGNLFVSFGDNTNPFIAGSYAPIDPERPLADARRSSANTKDLRGKILRITPRPDGSYTVPAGNLFPDSTQGRPEIYVMGNRNPYRISVDPHTGFLYWGEVGPDARVDSLPGPRGYDEVNQARRAGNFGWPMFIADNQAYRDRNVSTGWVGELFDPARPVNDSRNNTGAKVLPPAQPALIYYPYASSEKFPLVGEGGRTAMAGPVYHYDDFPASELKFPRYYDGKLIAYEWIRGWMRAVTMNEQGDYVDMEPLLEHLAFDHPMDMEFGPDGTLYLLEYGTEWFKANPGAKLSRIVYHAGNRPPVTEMTLDRTAGALPLTVALSARRSFDYDPGDTLSFTWTFDDGSTARGPTATHTFTTAGRHTVRLTARDPSGATSEATQEILAGNAPPVARILVEGNRSFFWDNAARNYHVTVTDAEDGSLGAGIDPERVSIAFDYVPEGVGRTLAAEGHQESADPRGLALIQGSDCLACHTVEQPSLGPSYRQVAERYAGQSEAVAHLVTKIIEGGSGVWGERVMPAHPRITQAEAGEMARYILSLTGGGPSLAATGTLRLNRHKPGENGAYVLSVAYDDQPRNGVGPLQARAELVLRSPTVPAASIPDARFVTVVGGKGADGTEHALAAPFRDGAYLHLGPTDLTGVGGVRMAYQPLGRAFTLELRAGGPTGPVLASQAAQAPAQEGWAGLLLPLRTAGEHDLYFVLRSDATGLGPESPLVRLDTFRFERATGGA